MSRVCFMIAFLALSSLAFWFGSAMAGTFFFGFAFVGIPLLFKRPRQMPIEINLNKPKRY